MPRIRKTFPQISPRAFEHPLDRTALTSLQKIKGFDWLVRKFLTTIGERRLRLFFLASAARVSDDQFPRIQRLYHAACDTLDIENRPELFVSQQSWANAMAIGVDQPFIVVTSWLCEMLDDDELQCVLGHELGHVMCGHALYTTVLQLLLKAWYVFLGLPGGAIAAWGILLALLEWSRKAELTADRVGLLVTQDLDVCHHVDMKLAGGKQIDQMSARAFAAQAQEYEKGGDLLDGVLKLLFLFDRNHTHPFPVLRVVELTKWAESDEYASILAGTYERRDDAPNTWVENVKATASAYKESFDSSRDPLLQTLRDLGGGAAAAGSELFELFKRFTTGKTSTQDDDTTRSKS